MLVSDMRPGMYARSKDFLLFRCDETCAVLNDLGHRVGYTHRDTEVELIPEWDSRLWENESFEILKYSDIPNHRILLRKQNGVRFFAEVRNYEVNIVFNFKSTDPRIDYGSAQWVGVFKTLPIMKNSLFNFITYDEKIVLHCDSFTKNITIPSR